MLQLKNKRKPIDKMAALIVAYGFLISATGVNAEDFSISRNAYAHALSDNRLLYIEKHEELWQDNHLTRSFVRYFSPDNKLLAEKKIDFSQSSTAPSFELHDLRDGYFEGAKIEFGRIKLSARRDSQQALKEKLVSIPPPVVIDGGFDQFVKTNWNDIQQGKVVHFNFVAPIEQDFFAFSVQKKAEVTFSNQDALVLEMRADSALVRMFVRPITLTYDRHDQSLLQFEGMTNLNNEKGKSYVARLVYPREEVKRMASSALPKNENVAVRE